MAITMANVHMMEEYGLLAAGQNILDLGSSNLYNATSAEIIGFVRRHAGNVRPDLADWSENLARGSGIDSGGQAKNESFAGELFEAAGMRYQSIDIADGYKTTLLDLNSDRLPKSMRNAYDTVLNCGTSEHILDQFNVFSALHEAAKPNGLFLHMVPSVGYVDHGYFCYTSRFFFDLAAYNNYEIVDMWFDQAAGEEHIYRSARQYQLHFPALATRLEMIADMKHESQPNNTPVPTISISLIFQKTSSAPFHTLTETSTSVGMIKPGAGASLKRGPAGRALPKLRALYRWLWR